jgi:uncharacterized membrane protein YidH (DUF202 family)
VVESTGSRATLIFLALFGGSFAVVGLGVGITHIPEALQSGDTEKLVLSLIFATLFPTVGIGIVWLGFFNRNRVSEQGRLRERYPDQPWMWKKEWAEGRIPGEGKKKL